MRGAVWQHIVRRGKVGITKDSIAGQNLRLSKIMCYIV